MESCGIDSLLMVSITYAFMHATKWFFALIMKKLVVWEHIELHQVKTHRIVSGGIIRSGFS